ncbi:uncharacterized protein ATNIH1004_001303 [Aspergillus tanneri]|uniref:Uncharacterized protein n=1 Tax=Aspergillus tanneri TaxID=1220188 RepID=A0A5M9N5R0_9EURO|nr:uncharacterized protein ATNIH1004_001303 [Aspergillus tanneri]KAA8652399.1 hypothetical protein ATNIH1004_001303 [Aspergillus tanneri]
MDRDFGRGKRTIQIDLASENDQGDLDRLLDDAHVFVQGFRPGALAASGLSPETLAQHFQRRGIVCAKCLRSNLLGDECLRGRAFWGRRRGTAYSCQAPDHVRGYFLAAGIMAALYKQATEGGSWRVDVPLAGVMKYLRSLGSGKDEYLETRDTRFDPMTAVGIPL